MKNIISFINYTVKKMGISGLLAVVGIILILLGLLSCEPDPRISDRHRDRPSEYSLPDTLK